MLGEYKVSRCTRRCHDLDRPLREGEWYYSVVIESDDDYIRRDYSAENWQGPPEGAVGWWKNRMPTSDEKKLVPAPPEVLVDLVRTMESVPEKAKSRYLLALMLLRRKVVRASDDDVDRNLLRIEVATDGSQIDVPVCQITRDESEQLLEELNELLYCEADPETPDEPSGQDDPASDTDRS